MTRLRRRAWMLRLAADEATDGLHSLMGAARTILAMLFGRVPPKVKPGVMDSRIVQWRGEIWSNHQEIARPNPRENLDGWKCPINVPGCVRNCGSYGCGN